MAKSEIEQQLELHFMEIIPLENEIIFQYFYPYAPDIYYDLQQYEIDFETYDMFEILYMWHEQRYAPLPVEHVYEYPWWADIIGELEDITGQTLIEHYNHQELDNDLLELNNFLEQFDQANWFNDD